MPNWCPTCQSKVSNDHNHKTRNKKYLSISDLSNEDQILSKARDIAEWGVRDWDETDFSDVTVEDVEIGGSFLRGEATPPKSDLDIIVHIEIPANFEIPKKELAYQLGSTTYPAKQHHVNDIVEYNIDAVDFIPQITIN